MSEKITPERIRIFISQNLIVLENGDIDENDFIRHMEGLTRDLWKQEYGE